MAGGCATRIKETGEGGRNVVLLHGYLESIEVWDDFQKALSKHARVLSLDLPGHGISEVKGDIHTMEFLADTVVAAMKSAGMERAVIIGHSMGGYAALEILRKYPQSVAGIVLFHSAPYPDDEEKKIGREREINLILGGKKELIAKMFPQAGFAPQNRERLAEKIEELTDQTIITEDEGIIALLRGMGERRDNNETLRAAAIPELMIFGRYDEYIPPTSADAVIAAQPQAQAVWLENSGHMGFAEEPDKSLGLILAFLNRVYGKE